MEDRSPQYPCGMGKSHNRMRVCEQEHVNLKAFLKHIPTYYKTRESETWESEHKTKIENESARDFEKVRNY